MSGVAAPPDAQGAPASTLGTWPVVTGLLTAFTVVESLGFGHFSAFIPLYLPQLGVGPEELPRWTALFPGASFILGIPLAPFWGVWADKYGRKLIILRGVYIETLVFFLAAAAGNVWLLFAARMMVGLALGWGGVSFAVIAQLTPRRHVGLAFATVTMGTTLGLALGPAIGGPLTERIGYRALFTLDGFLLLLGSVVLTLFLRVPPPRRKETRGVWQMLAALGRNLWAHPPVLAFFGLYFLASTGLYMARSFTPLLIKDLYLGDNLPTTVGLIVFVANLANGLATPGWGKLGDRAGYARMLALGVGGAALAILAQALVGSLPALVAALVLQGLGQSGISPLIIASVATRTPESIRASILNLAYMPTYFASFFAAAAGSQVVALGIRAPYVAGGLLLLAALGVLWGIDRMAAVQKRREPSL